MEIFVILGIIISIVSILGGSSKKRPNQTRPDSRRVQMPAGQQAEPTPAYRQESDAERRARQEELKRRLRENAARREAEKARQPIPEAKPNERRPLEKAVLETALRKEKPVVDHDDEDCGGGSIHDGYHEGVTQFVPSKPAAVAGSLGQHLADEDERLESEARAAENAKKAMSRIAKLPPLAQGMIYSEILGKPKSEIA